MKTIFTPLKEALDVDPYVSYDVFNFQTIRSFYEHLQLETNLSLERIQEIILPGNSLVKWGENVFNLIELWRIKSRGIKQMLEIKSEDEVLVYLSLVSSKTLANALVLTFMKPIDGYIAVYPRLRPRKS